MLIFGMTFYLYTYYPLVCHVYIVPCVRLCDVLMVLFLYYDHGLMAVSMHSMILFIVCTYKYTLIEEVTTCAQLVGFVLNKLH